VAGTPPTSLRIRDLTVAPCAMLAPMEGVTDLTFRRLVRRIGGCGMTFTEFIPAGGLAAQIQRALDMVKFDPDERPVGIQVYGREPALLAEAARIAQDMGPDVVDLNMGCPSKKVCAHSGGSALMKEPAKAREIVRAMRAALEIPFTVKMRSGWDLDHKNAPDLARMCEDEGVEAVTVHWRTRADLYGGERELDTLAAVVDAVSIPVIANGDVVDATSALDTLARTGAAGVMIGRGAIRNPWVFREVEAALHGLPAPIVTPEDRMAVLLGYLDDIHARFDHERRTLGRFKKISRYFTDAVPGGDALRQAIFHSHSLDEVVGRVHAHFADLERHAGAAAR
jgi:tRNA-dihydrouridine synthase B